MVARARFVAPFALAALSAAAALSLGRVFASGRFVVPVLVAVALAHASGALARRLAWPAWAVFVGQLAVLVVVVTIAYGPHFSVAGVAFGSDTSVFTLLDRGLHAVRTVTPPIPATDGAVLLAVLVCFVVAAVGDWLAFRRQAVLAATAPALVLFVWAVTLGTGDNRIATAVGFGAAAIAFLLVQHVAVLDRGRGWLVSRDAPRMHWIAPAVLLAIGALAISVAIAPALPGADGEPLLDIASGDRTGGAGSSYRTGVAPFVDVSTKLNDTADTELFTVTAGHPDYWRVAALDQFDNESGGQWTLRASGDQVSVGLPESGPSGSFHQHIVIGPMGERWLPAAYRPVAIDLDGTLVVESSSTLVADEENVEGLTYNVDSETPLTGGQVTAPAEAATDAPVPAGLARYTTLPSDTPADIGALAQRIVTDAGATTPYAQAEALRDYFRTDGFVYDTSVPPSDTPDAILAFLEERRGFCVQFASAYAVMARSLGIPTRIAVGFTPGDDVDGVYHVSAHDAHAWPEVWLAGLGWTHLFDPTPSSSTVASGGSALPDETPVTPLAAPRGPDTPTATTSVGTAPGQSTAPGATDTTPTTAPTMPTGAAPPASPEVTTESSSSTSSTSLWLIVVLVLLVVVAVAVAYVVLLAAARARRRDRRRAGTPHDVVQGAWDEALDQLRGARVPTDSSLTPLELSRIVPVRSPAAARPLGDLADRYTSVRYGTTPPTDADAERAWAATEELAAALATDVEWRERWRRRLDPRPLSRAR